ncbi:MAG: arsenic resistance protein [Spirochaetales bacterium]|nr:arsenic resistance protein [Spirochaetales bacterium]
MKTITKMANHLRNQLLWYALGAIFVGWVLGLLFPSFVKTHHAVLNTLVTVFVFFMIYPMMINMDLSKILGVMRKPKPIIATIIYNFIITPILSLIIVFLFIHNKEIALGFMLVMLIPGSSMSLGYTGIVEGSMEFATVAMGITFLLIPILLPFFIHFLGTAYNVPVPLGLLLQTVIIVLILPMIAGGLTRHGIVKFKGKEGFNKVKPLFSFTTLSTMLLMVAVIFMLKATVLVKEWQTVINLALITLVYLAIMFVLMTVVNKMLKINYGDHMAIAFLSTGKNNGTAIAIAMLAFTPLVAIPAAILPLFQIIFSIGYVYMAKTIRRFFNGPNAAATIPPANV